MEMPVFSSAISSISETTPLRRRVVAAPASCAGRRIWTVASRPTTDSKSTTGFLQVAMTSILNSFEMPSSTVSSRMLN